MKNIVYLWLLICLVSTQLLAQNNLNKTISIITHQQPISDVLEIISNKGNFYFSYNSNILGRDSLVSITVTAKTVEQVLHLLFPSGFEFKESGNYIIIRRKPIAISIVTNTVVVQDRWYNVTGYVQDLATGGLLQDASVYELNQLASALSDQKGHFSIKLKSKYRKPTLTVSKEYYEDTTIAVNPAINEKLQIILAPIETQVNMVTPQDYLVTDTLAVATQPDTVVAITNFSASPPKDSTLNKITNVDRSWMGKWLVSSRQTIQSLNIGNFFATRPFQFSLTPGLSSHGKMSGQVINNFSFNLLGGYAGGLKGIELGGLFNIDKKDVGYIQIAGLLNLVGGKMVGLQMSGIANSVRDTLIGIQLAGIGNFAGNEVKGFQAASIYNHAEGTVYGVQSSGIINYARRPVYGAQYAGIANFAQKMNGVQVAGIINYTNHLKGVQIGLINIADTSDGYSIGLINFVRRGYHKITIGQNEIADINVSFKSGNKKLYSILLAGNNYSSYRQLFTFGYGIGNQIIGNKKVALTNDATVQAVYLGNWNAANLLMRYSLQCNAQLNKWLAIYGGLSFNGYFTNQNEPVAGFAFQIPKSGFIFHEYSANWRSWGGWQIGVALF